MKLETMTEDDLDEAQALTTSFNWPHTVEDWSFAFGLGSGHVARAGGRLLGTCLTWRLAAGVSTLGFLAVSEEAQGQGLGRALLRRALGDQPGQTTLLHATHQAVDLYRSEGFEPIGQVQQFQGVVRPACGKAVQTDTTPVRLCADLQASMKFDQLLALDFEATAIDRRPLLEALRLRSTLAEVGAGDEPEGFALIRPFGRGHVIGPVIAASRSAGRALVSGLLEAHVDRFVRIDLTEDLSGSDWLTERGLSEVDQVLAMSNGPLPRGSGRLKRLGLIGHAFG